MINADFYPPGLADDAFAPYNQEVDDTDPREELFQEMVDYLEERDSTFERLHLDKQGWFFEKEADSTRYPLPVKYWIVAK